MKFFPDEYLTFWPWWSKQQQQQFIKYILPLSYMALPKIAIKISDGKKRKINDERSQECIILF